MQAVLAGLPEGKVLQMLMDPTGAHVASMAAVLDLGDRQVFGEPGVRQPGGGAIEWGGYDRVAKVGQAARRVESAVVQSNVRGADTWMLAKAGRQQMRQL